MPIRGNILEASVGRGIEENESMEVNKEIPEPHASTNSADGESNLEEADDKNRKASKMFNQQELNDFVRDLGLSKENAELLAFRLKETGFLTKTTKGFTWDAMLKHTKVIFKLLIDFDVVLFIESGIRGGLSQYSGRYAQANNKYMQSYNLLKLSSYLMYFDVNNLLDLCCLSLIALDSPICYILEVDLEYPQRLHVAHADLLFCPTRAKPPGKRQDKLL
ncbi:PREDICTED: uncharacterized protein LOC106742049, partial [Dinoponera quadriceps]|uniref:Uncharacterized protein LOC106742049 n=1 Tax=Dinoponera quadriceps TaxID=609295 RepID=A0A6P3WVK9_DINQU